MLTPPKFAHIAEHWESASESELALFKAYAQQHYGVPHSHFLVSVFVRQTFIDIVIKAPAPVGLLTISRATGTRIAYGPWIASDWQTVPADADSDAFIREIYGSTDTPLRMEVVNDMEILDVMLYDCDGAQIAKIVIDKDSGLIIDRDY